MRTLIQMNGYHRRAAQDAGLLALGGAGGPKAMTYCSLKEFRDFDTAFVSLARIAKCLGENTQVLRRRLAAAGVECVLPVWRGGIYARADVELLVGIGAVPLVMPAVD